MCIDSGSWNSIKKQIAQEIGELTLIWNVGINNRNNAIRLGCKSIKDNSCSSSILNLSGQRGDIVDKIININKSLSTTKISPTYIKNNINNWKLPTHKNKIYIDFETFNDLFSDFNQLPQYNTTNQLFMIGAGYIDDNSKKWTYKNFTMKFISLDEEYNIMNNFVKFLKTNFSNPILYFWYAETNIWNQAKNRQLKYQKENNSDKYFNILNNWNWTRQLSRFVDIHNIFLSEPIVVRGCFKFGLKEIASAMYKHNLIKTNLNTNCTDGFTAMINAWNIYKTNKNSNIFENPTMIDVIKYNEFDCKILYEIIDYIVKHHT